MKNQVNVILTKEIKKVLITYPKKWKSIKCQNIPLNEFSELEEHTDV